MMHQTCFTCTYIPVLTPHYSLLHDPTFHNSEHVLTRTYAPLFFSQVRLFAILSPVGPYFKDGFNPIKLYADTENVRAWPGGTGNAKVRTRTLTWKFDERLV